MFPKALPIITLFEMEANEDNSISINVRSNELTDCINILSKTLRFYLTAVTYIGNNIAKMHFACSKSEYFEHLKNKQVA